MCQKWFDWICCWISLISLWSNIKVLQYIEVDALNNKSKLINIFTIKYYIYICFIVCPSMLLLTSPLAPTVRPRPAACTCGWSGPMDAKRGRTEPVGRARQWRVLISDISVDMCIYAYRPIVTSGYNKYIYINKCIYRYINVYMYYICLVDMWNLRCISSYKWIYMNIMLSFSLRGYLKSPNWWGLLPYLYWPPSTIQLKTWYRSKNVI